MNKKISLVFTLILTVIMTATVLIYGKKGEDRSKENIFAVKYNTAYGGVKEVQNFDKQEGIQGIEYKIINANNYIKDLEKFINKNSFVQNSGINETITKWKDSLIMEQKQLYKGAKTILESINDSDSKTTQQWQDFINKGNEYVEALEVLDKNEQGIITNEEVLKVKEEYKNQQKSLERVLYNALENARKEKTQSSIDEYNSLVPKDLPNDIKDWYEDTAKELQTDLLNSVGKKVGILYSSIESGRDKDDIENQKKDLENGLQQFLQSKNYDIREWAQEIINNLKTI